MENKKLNQEKLCSFYISDWHLVTMILPCINKEINEKANIVTLLENNIEENIKTLISKLNLKNENKILELNWTNTSILNCSNIENNFNMKDNLYNIILICGSKEYIDNMHKMIDKKLGDILKGKLKIIDCYEVTEFNENIKEILDNHDRILNTAGEKEIGEVFEGYSKECSKMDEVS